MQAQKAMKKSSATSSSTLGRSASAPLDATPATSVGEAPRAATTLSYPERIPKARLEATLLNRELDDTLFDARLRQGRSPGAVAERAAAGWIGGGVATRTVDGLLAKKAASPAKHKNVLKPLVRDTSEGGHGACFTVTLPVGDQAIDGVLGKLLEQSRSKAAGLRGAVRRALSREEELLDEGDGPSWASADAQKFHGRCVRRLEEHVEQLSRERDESLALLRKAHDCSIEDRRAKLGVEAELEATVARLEQVRVEVASRRKMDAVRKVYFDDMADRVEKLDARNRALQEDAAAREAKEALGPVAPEVLDALTYMLNDAAPDPARLEAYFADPNVGPALAKLRRLVDVGDERDAASRADSACDLAEAPAPADAGAPAPAPGAAALAEDDASAALYLASGKRIWVAEEPLAAPVPPEKLELAEAAAPDDDDDRDGDAARDVAAAATPIEDLADDDRFASGDAPVAVVAALRDRHFFKGAQLARVDAALDAAANDDTLVGVERAAAVLGAVHPQCAMFASRPPEGEPFAARLQGVAVLGGALLGACPSALHVLDEPDAKQLLQREASRRRVSAVATVAALLRDVDLSALSVPRPDKLFEQIASIYAAHVGSEATLRGHSMAKIARKFLTRRLIFRHAADDALGELALGVDQLARDYALARLFARVAGVPRGLKQKRNSFAVPAVFAALEASARHDPLASPRALDFFVVALSTLVPRDKIIEKLGAKEEQVLDLGQVAALAPNLFQIHVFDAHKLYPWRENALTTDLPFYADLVRSLDARAALVEPDPISLKLRVKLADALEALVAHWPAATDHAARETRRYASRLIQKRARGGAARARHAETVKAKAAAFERARVEREFRKCDINRDGLLNLETFHRLLRTLDPSKSQDEVLEEYELAVDGSRRHRERNRHDYDDDDRDDREANDALVVAEVVHALTQPRHVHVEPPPPAAFVAIPVAPDFMHNTWAKDRNALREGEVRLSAP
ncbi:hypothetical protein JL720_8405 [Aureococcus anophagefferens]|nr:hypothetical protein JL720_8405 [Aureococcus anophagefferens]